MLAEQGAEAIELTVHPLVLRDDGPDVCPGCPLLLQPQFLGPQLPFPSAQRRGALVVTRLERGRLLPLHLAELLGDVREAPDPLLSEQVCAFVVPRPGARIDRDVVRAHFAGLGVARHKTPERVETVTDLPRTATGKVKKTDLRALLRTQAEHAPVQKI